MELRVCATDEEYEAWRAVRLAVLPEERCLTVEEMRAQDSPDRVLLLAMEDQAVQEVYTWTQAGNVAMRRLNESLGYVTTRTSITVSRSLPLTT